MMAVELRHFSAKLGLMNALSATAPQQLGLMNALSATAPQQLAGLL